MLTIFSGGRSPTLIIVVSTFLLFFLDLNDAELERADLERVLGRADLERGLGDPELERDLGRADLERADPDVDLEFELLVDFRGIII